MVLQVMMSVTAAFASLDSTEENSLLRDGHHRLYAEVMVLKIVITVEQLH